ncbi:MAG: hypothetical protein M3141_09980, partial [Actinomycetota bacterium]|nr:hypothetical protein [Actinomycetota bacterium]
MATVVGGLAGGSPAAADPTPARAYGDLSAWRAELGEAPVTAVSSEHPTYAPWDSGCQQHNQYQALNGWAMTHEQDADNPGATEGGARAAPNSVLAQHGSFPNPVPDSRMLPRAAWEAAIYHRMALIEPRLNRIGYDAETFEPTAGRTYYTSFVCLWSQTGQDEEPSAFDNTRTTPELTLYPSPANGASNVPTRFGANETPNPADEAGVPADQLGWLLSVSHNGPWRDQAFASAHSVSATLAADAAPAERVPVAISQCGPAGCFTAGDSP